MPRSHRSPRSPSLLGPPQAHPSGQQPHENISAESRRRALRVSGSVGPMTSKNLTSCLLAASSFHLRSRLKRVSNSSIAASRSPLPNSAVANSKRAS